jgi:2-amino-4-hydroxy-6-hydroxymethyldihydropteridine diphosphokinase
MEINSYNTVFLSLGSNQGERLYNIEKALTKITVKVGEIYLKSPIYENPPLGFEAEQNFYNLCIGIKTKYNPEDLLLILQQIELEIGRDKKTVDKQYSSRKIDIDIIFFNDSVINTKNLSIPHLLFRQRNFVLKPLCDIAAMYIDPITGFTVDYLYSKSTDKSLLLLV